MCAFLDTSVPEFEPHSVSLSNDGKSSFIDLGHQMSTSTSTTSSTILKSHLETSTDVALLHPSTKPHTTKGRSKRRVNEPIMPPQVAKSHRVRQ